FTTFRLGGPAAQVTIAETREELLEFCRAHQMGLSGEERAGVLFIGGGSNLLIADDGFDGPVCVVRTTGVTATETTVTDVRVTAEAGEDWDDFVAHTLSLGLSGLEALSGIPGCVGATPIQHVGAYGTEVGELITSVQVFDRVAGQVPHLGAQARADRGRDTAVRGAVGDLRPPAQSAVPASALRPARLRPRRRDRRPGGSGPRARERHRTAPLEGDGARPRRPRLVVG